jgi:hypothetical protein
VSAPAPLTSNGKVSTSLRIGGTYEAGADFGVVKSAIPKGPSSKLDGKGKLLRNRRQPKAGVCTSPVSKLRRPFPRYFFITVRLHPRSTRLMGGKTALPFTRKLAAFATFTRLLFRNLHARPGSGTWGRGSAFPSPRPGMVRVFARIPKSFLSDFDHPLAGFQRRYDKRPAGSLGQCISVRGLFSRQRSQFAAPALAGNHLICKEEPTDRKALSVATHSLTPHSTTLCGRGRDGHCCPPPAQIRTSKVARTCSCGPRLFVVRGGRTPASSGQRSRPDTVFAKAGVCASRRGRSRPGWPRHSK